MAPDFFYEIKNVEGFQHAIIAGGAVRDTVGRKPIKDLDIFVPCMSQNDFINICNHLRQQNIITLSDEIMDDSYELDFDFFGKYDGRHEETGWDVDIVGYRHIRRDMSESHFANFLIPKFHFDIDRGYSFGPFPIPFREMMRDLNNNTATLSYIDEAAPNSIIAPIRKFDRLAEKYQGIEFRNNLITRVQRNNTIDEFV